VKTVYLAFGVLLLSLVGCGGGGGNGGSANGGGNNGGGGSGRLYVADGGNHGRIVRMDNINGDNFVSFGTHGSGVNQLSSPRCIAFDSQGRIYITDWGNDRIVRIDDMSGTNWVTYGSTGSGQGQFEEPNKIVIDGNGRIYISDTGNNRIVRIDDMTGANWASYGTPGSGGGNFNGPYGLAVDNSFHIYVGDVFNHRIVRFDNMAGANWTTFSDNSLVAPGDIRIYGNKMLVNDRDGKVILTDLMSTNNWKQLLASTPQSSMMGSNGKIYVVDQSADLLSEYPSMSGGVPVTYGTLGQESFDNPGHVIFGP